MALLKNKLILIITAVLLVGGGGAYYFLALSKKEPTEAKKKSHHEEEEERQLEEESTNNHGDDQEEVSAVKKKPPDEEAEEEEDEEDEVEARGNGHGEKKGPIIEPFVVNLADPGSRRYLRVNLKLALKNPEENEPILEARMPQIRDTVLLLLTSKTSDQLSSPEGKVLLRQELIEQINTILKRKKTKKAVKNLYFTEFLIQ